MVALFSDQDPASPVGELASNTSRITRRDNAKPFLGMVVCPTGVKSRDVLLAMAQELGATCSKNLTDSTTHLVADTPDGVKYEVAVELGLPICTSDWIFETYQRWLAGEHIDPDQTVSDYSLHSQLRGNVSRAKVGLSPLYNSQYPSLEKTPSLSTVKSDVPRWAGAQALEQLRKCLEMVDESSRELDHIRRTLSEREQSLAKQRAELVQTIGIIESAMAVGVPPFTEHTEDHRCMRLLSGPQNGSDCATDQVTSFPRSSQSMHWTARGNSSVLSSDSLVVEPAKSTHSSSPRTRQQKVAPCLSRAASSPHLGRNNTRKSVRFSLENAPYPLRSRSASPFTQGLSPTCVTPAIPTPKSTYKYEPFIDSPKPTDVHKPLPLLLPAPPVFSAPAGGRASAGSTSDDAVYRSTPTTMIELYDRPYLESTLRMLPHELEGLTLPQEPDRDQVKRQCIEGFDTVLEVRKVPDMEWARG